MTMNHDVMRIIEILDFRAYPEPLKKTRLLSWFESSEPNVVGAATEAVLRHSQNVRPPLTRLEVGDLLMKNFSVSLDNRGEKVSTYAYNCHEAAKEFYGWVIAAHDALPDGEAEECMRAATEFMERRYRAGDEGQRNCLIAGALEHIFEVDGLRDWFDGWRDDAELSFAYRKAEEWRSWVAARVRSLDAVVMKVADHLRARGVDDVVVARPIVGTTMPLIRWHDKEQHELAFMCDEAWVEAAEAHAVDVLRAAKFAANPDNWSHSPNAPKHFTVELQGEGFMTARQGKT